MAAFKLKKMQSTAHRGSEHKWMRFILLSLVLLMARPNADAQVRRPRPSDPALQHPAPGTSIIRFAQVDVGVYRGSKPERDADFRFLQSKHIRYILDANFLPFLSEPEAKKARKYGMVFLSSPMNGSPIAPSEKHVDRILLTLRDKRYQPIYFHCDLGRDRTSLIAALYKMYFLGMSRQAAWREMEYYGFKDSWTLRGLKVYFEKHSKPSLSLMRAARTLNR